MPDSCRTSLGHWLQSLPSLLPSSCALCGTTSDRTVCTACRRHYFTLRRQRCRQCAVAVAGPAILVCGTCLAHPPAFDASIVATDYAPPLDQLVLALKFGHQLALAPMFAELLYDAVENDLPEADALPEVLTVVPLGRQRLQERGFNQALEIARPLSRLLRRPLLPSLLARLRDTRAQSQLRLQERQANLRQAFTILPGHLAQVQGRHIGVIDDVMTTGATLNELAKTLKQQGAARVTNLVVARPLAK